MVTERRDRIVRKPTVLQARIGAASGGGGGGGGGGRAIGRTVSARIVFVFVVVPER